MITMDNATGIVSLEEILATEREDAAVLRRRGHARDADLIDGLLDRVVMAAEDFITWLDEPDAVTRSGHVASWLRKQFPAWRSEGHARTNERGVRQYRKCIIPQRGHKRTATEAGRRAGLEEAVRRTR